MKAQNENLTLKLPLGGRICAQIFQRLRPDVTVDSVICIIVLGKGPYQLTTYRERDTVITANWTSGVVLPRRRSTASHGLLFTFMMTPGLSRVRPHGKS